MKSIWTERDLQDYRSNICIYVMSTDCNECLKTRDEIIECEFDLTYDPDDEENYYENLF